MILIRLLLTVPSPESVNLEKHQEKGPGPCAGPLYNNVRISPSLGRKSVG